MNLYSFKRRIKALGQKNSRTLAASRIQELAHITLRKIFSPHPKKLLLGNFRVGDPRHIFVIAELGVNHNGNLATAKKLIDAAASAGADAVKFQKRDLESTYQKRVVTNPELYDQSFQYLIPILKECDFGEQQYRELKAYAEKKRSFVSGNSI